MIVPLPHNKIFWLCEIVEPCGFCFGVLLLLTCYYLIEFENNFGVQKKIKEIKLRTKELGLRATIYACFLSCLIQLFFEKFL